jgi:predicted SnoaL-like aldol condensation-catalyzing enzyme
VSAERHHALLRAVVDVFSTGDVSRLADLFGADYVDHQGLAGEKIHGIDGFARVVRAARNPDRYAALVVTIEDAISEGDRIAARLQWRHALRSGGEVRRETIDLLRIADGKIVEHWGAQTWREES